jgi:hypothetical protein
MRSVVAHTMSSPSASMVQTMASSIAARMRP